MVEGPVGSQEDQDLTLVLEGIVVEGTVVEGPVVEGPMVEGPMGS